MFSVPQDQTHAQRPASKAYSRSTAPPGSRIGIRPSMTPSVIPNPTGPKLISVLLRIESPKNCETAAKFAGTVSTRVRSPSQTAMKCFISNDFHFEVEHFQAVGSTGLSPCHAVGENGNRPGVSFSRATSEGSRPSRGRRSEACRPLG